MKMQQHPEGKSPTRRRVEIHIEELVLHGFAPGDRHRIAVAVREELSRLFFVEGIPESAGVPSAIARLDAGAVQTRAGTSARATGAKIGRAVYRSLRAQAGVPGAGRPALPAAGGGTR